MQPLHQYIITAESRRMTLREPIPSSSPIARSLRLRRRQIQRMAEMSFRRRSPGRQLPRHITSLNYHEVTP